MPTFSLASFKKIYLKNKLKFLELTFLSLFLAFLPSFEAPKNIFLAGYLITALYHQFQHSSSKWGIWDWVFLSLITSSFLSALFPLIATGSEWKSCKGMLLWIIFGWTLYRSEYNEREKKYLFVFAIFMTIPPLIFGLVQYLVLHTNDSFQLHSVGHVNHSAIYLSMISGGVSSLLHSQPQSAQKKYFFIKIFFLLLFLFSVVLSQSRGAFGITILVLILMGFLSKSDNKGKMVFFVLLGIFLVGVIFIKPAQVIEKQISSQQAGNSLLAGREIAWETAFEIARLNPLLGIGGGNWNQITIDQIKSLVELRGKIFDKDNFSALGFHHPHNIYLSNLVDRGILGLITFLSFTFIWLITLIKSYKKFNQDSKAMLFIMGSFSAWVTIFGIGLVNTTFHHENALLALFFLGLHLNYLRQKNQLKLF